MNTRALLVTHHHKADILRPIMESYGWTLDDLDLDTDALGTFSGDIPRRGSPLEVVTRKALLGRGHGRGAWLCASEGSVTTNLVGIATNLEIVALVSHDERVMITGEALEPDALVTSLRVLPTTSDEEIVECAVRGVRDGLHLMVSSDDHHTAALGALSSIEEVLAACRAFGRDTTLHVQTDYRAHLCPPRRVVIARATLDLMKRLATSCPRCHRGGWGRADAIIGRPCADCGGATDELLGHWWRCPWCHHTDSESIAGVDVDPSRCSWCNP